VDRRTALKKLAAGSAIAAGGSLVLSSNAVAQTCSAPPTAPPNPFQIQNIGDQMRVRDVSALDSVSSVVFGWQIVTYEKLGNKQRLSIRPNAGGTDILVGPNEDDCGTGCPYQMAGFTTQNPAHGDVLLALKDDNNIYSGFKKGSGRTYTVDVLVTWTFTNGCDPLTAQYRLVGLQQSLPTVQKL
jgi:hypothetical protein